jgi:CheY-like chemotaxis protein
MTGERVRALIVDDLALNLKLLSAILLANHFEVETATSAEAALERLATASFPLVLLDLRLPGMDGLTLASKLRADPVHREAVLVAVTANAMKSDQAAALAAGCDAFVTKPIDTRTLIPLVTRLLAQARTRRLAP